MNISARNATMHRAFSRLNESYAMLPNRRIRPQLFFLALALFAPIGATMFLSAKDSLKEAARGADSDRTTATAAEHQNPKGLCLKNGGDGKCV